jgi:hypothetical protein
MNTGNRMPATGMGAEPERQFFYHAGLISNHPTMNAISRVSRVSTVLLMGGLACSSSPAGAADFSQDYNRAKDRGRVSTAFAIDNDTLLLNDQDGFYTSGALIERKYWLEAEGKAEAFGWRIGQELYTAADIKVPPQFISAQDRPYAGWLFAGLYKQSWGSDGSRFHTGIDVGCLGPCAGGEWTQTKLHQLINQPLPRGWSTQVRNEMGIVLWTDIAVPRWAPGSWFDLTPSVHARFGNIYTDAGAALTLRAGRLNLLPTQPTLHAYLRLDASYVGYNATLQGGYFSSGSPRTVDPKRLVGEAELGVQWSEGAYDLRAAVVRRSNEVRDLPNSVGAQSFVRLKLTYSQ